MRLLRGGVCTERREWKVTEVYGGWRRGKGAWGGVWRMQDEVGRKALLLEGAGGSEWEVIEE